MFDSTIGQGVLAAVTGYLLGSIPFGLVLTRLAGKGDIRQIGSGNIGATNVLRSGSKGLAVATLLLDAGKGAVAVLLFRHLAAGAGSAPALIAGLFAVIGHNFPLWLRFRGGKGVATTLGVLAALAWPVALVVCIIWLAVAFVFRYSSLAALVALVAAPIVAAWWASPGVAVVALILAALAVVRHRANLRRLVAGTEPRIGA